MRTEKGFTLIELMVVLAVMGIIAGIAFPSLRDMIVNSRITTQTNEFIAALNFARSEAIKRGADVMVCADDEADLGNGWFINPGVACNTDLALVRHEALRELGLTPKTVSIGFNGRGGLATGAITFTLNPHDCPSGSDRKREVSILGAGRIAVSRKACS